MNRPVASIFATAALAIAALPNNGTLAEAIARVEAHFPPEQLGRSSATDTLAPTAFIYGNETPKVEAPKCVDTPNREHVVCARNTETDAIIIKDRPAPIAPRP